MAVLRMVEASGTAGPRAPANPDAARPRRKPRRERAGTLRILVLLCPTAGTAHGHRGQAARLPIRLP